MPDEPRPEKSVLDDWTDTLARELGVEVAVEITTLLEVARDAAHNVLRPAAPITTFLVGYAAAQRGGSATAIAEASAAASALALSWDAAAQGRSDDPQQTDLA